MERNYRLDRERDPTVSVPARQSPVRVAPLSGDDELAPFQGSEMNHVSHRGAGPRRC
jgi:hypothetical protein